MANYLIFGATGGIGTALARLLSQEGAKLALAATNATKLHALAAEVHARPFQVDATQPDAVAQVIQQAQDQFGGLDGVANCIGSLLLKPAHLTSPEEWHQVLRVNLDTSFYIVKAASRALMKAGGSIVLCSSGVSRFGFNNHEAIAAAKAGINGLVLATAATYAKRGIRVNAVAPGLVRTPMTAHLTANEASEKASLAMHALGRLGTPEDIAKAIRFFLDQNQSSWITGQVLAVDGGLSSLRPS